MVTVEDIYHVALLNFRLQGSDLLITTLDLTHLDVDPSHETLLTVEDEITLGLAPGYEKCGASHLVRHATRGADDLSVGTIEFVEIEIAQNVYVVNEDRRRGIEKRSSLLQPPARLQQHVALIGDADVNTEIVVGVEIIYNLVGKMMHVDNNAVETCITEFLYDMFQQRLSPYSDQSLRHTVGQRF